jgi:hypothetical protein
MTVYSVENKRNQITDNSYMTEFKSTDTQGDNT